MIIIKTVQKYLNIFIIRQLKERMLSRKLTTRFFAKTIAKPPLPGGSGGGGDGQNDERRRRERSDHWKRVAQLNALFNHDSYLDTRIMKRFHNRLNKTFLPVPLKNNPKPILFFDMNICTRLTPTSRTPFYYLVIRKSMPLYDASIYREKMHHILTQLLNMNALWIVENALRRQNPQNLLEDDIWILLGVSDQENS